MHTRSTLSPRPTLSHDPVPPLSWYFAFDHNDRVFEDPAWRARVTAEILRSVDEEDARRWHGANYSRPASVAADGSVALSNLEALAVDSTALLVTVHWVHCDYASKPSWAHSDAIMAAYREGADYAYRGNDDSKLPETRMDWVDAFILDLRSRTPANVGIVGPACEQGAKWILTHDFTHRTHALIFGLHYPRSLPDWSSDDWITIREWEREGGVLRAMILSRDACFFSPPSFPATHPTVYRQFKPSLTVRREDIPVIHELHGTVRGVGSAEGGGLFFAARRAHLSVLTSPPPSSSATTRPPCKHGCGRSTLSLHLALLRFRPGLRRHMASSSRFRVRW